MNREFVMLSHNLKLDEIGAYSLGNWFASEKLDGMRAIWLPDTKGVQVKTLPFANLDKDRTGTGNRYASGLWSRYAKPIWAPEWFTAQLPNSIFLDGELWTGRRQFQKITSIVKKGTPGPEWEDVQYRVFDSPSPDLIYRDGKIHNNTLKKNLKGNFEWCKNVLPFDYKTHNNTFETTYFQVLLNRKPIEAWGEEAVPGVVRITDMVRESKHLIVHPQEQLPWRHADAVERVRAMTDDVLAQGGEGLILRAPHSTWEPVRSKVVLKVKPTEEAEGTVIGYTMGQGRLEGMIGALTIQSQGKVFGLSGLSDEERYLPTTLFVAGTVITYTYRELSDDGVPKEARFLRIRDDF